MNYSILALGLAALLVGCEGDGSRPYVANSSDACLAQGYQYGTNSYKRCLQRTSYRQNAASPAQPWASNPPPQSQQVDQTPQFDRQGNPNFDTNGNYIGPHGVGKLVGPEDNRDLNPNLQSPTGPEGFAPGECTTNGINTQCHSSSTSRGTSSSTCTTINGETTCDSN